MRPSVNVEALLLVIIQLR